MAPPEALKPKATPKNKSLPAATNATKKTTSLAKKAMKVLTPKVINTTAASRQRTNTVPKVATPKPKDNKSIPVPMPSSVTKSGKKVKRRLQAAHSGVPIPEKMKRLQAKLLDPNFKF